ncbi:Transcriptional regulator, contains XRE-family HTH domain [Roseivivax halotolerans]|uniref:Transcriptional regulator, contains XRE-family HTH domain n=1 Tax=Roseivivax halotolerans TaxID=93684 RepID=A0A1I6AC95_9RHOB|nr:MULTISPECIES: helix-turn-helix transcriptional regulator [Roseivivax]QFT64464.1 HTH-type transcriptional regulator ImmR [Roseivivax sp. THAF30]SFQ66356.1 Transcriptional regulator, contains XRE-family HTH domain [Roseivivax halotolerans]
MTSDFDWYGPEAATFGDRIAAARDAAQMTPEQLARRLGVKLRTLQNWENDLSEPRANKLSMISGLLNVSMIWLLTGEGDGVSAPSEEISQTADIRDALAELRAIRTEMKTLAERAGRVEKRLRTAVQTETA